MDYLASINSLQDSQTGDDYLTTLAKSALGDKYDAVRTAGETATMVGAAADTTKAQIQEGKTAAIEGSGMAAPLAGRALTYASARLNPQVTRTTTSNFTSGEGEAAEGVGTSTGEGAEGGTEMTADASRFTSAVPDEQAAEVVRNPMQTGAEETKGGELGDEGENMAGTEGTEMTEMGGEASTTTDTGGEVVGETGTEMTEMGTEAATTGTEAAGESAAAGTEAATGAGEAAAAGGEAAAAGAEAGATLAEAGTAAAEIAVAGGGGLNPIADAVGAAVLVGGLIYGGIELWGGHHHDNARSAKSKASSADAAASAEGSAQMSKLSANSHLGVTGGVEKVRNSFGSSGGTF